MHKLVILVEPLDDWAAFDEQFPEFLHRAEQMPGLLKEAISQVERPLYGSLGFTRVYELFFETNQAIQEAMASPVGQEAGRLLQAMTQGKMVLFLADHQEDDLERIRRFRKPNGNPNPDPDSQ